MLAFLDRSKIGNARIAGMQKELSLDSSDYQWLLNIFYIAYVVAEFGVILWKLFPPHIVGAVVVLGWGLVATIQAGTHSWSGIMALRFLLGVFEAAYRWVTNHATHNLTRCYKPETNNEAVILHHQARYHLSLVLFLPTQ